MYKCKFSEPIHSSIGEIVTCGLNHCRCVFNGDENNHCLDFKFKGVNNMNGFNASVIIEVYAEFYRGEYVLNCPYCHELNILPDSNRGYRICGACGQIFDVR